jgi:Family of unknown function (DUF6455)
MPNINVADRRWRNMADMLDRLGLNSAMLAHGRLATGLRSAVCTCQSCDADQLCQAWLLRAPEWIDAAPAFCANAELFACEREIVYGDSRDFEDFDPDADVTDKVIDDLRGDFGRSDAISGAESERK